MKNVISTVLVSLTLILCVYLAGCGNVSLTGDAMIAAQQSAMDAYQASVRADTDATTPAWERMYLQENFKQWRSYVRSANKNATWGPLLPSEKATSQPAQ